MSEPHIVSPEEAQERLKFLAVDPRTFVSKELAQQLAHTIATEPDRIRAAVVKALREKLEGAWDAGWASAYSGRVNAEQAITENPYRADDIENGAPL